MGKGCTPLASTARKQFLIAFVLFVSAPVIAILWDSRPERNMPIAELLPHNELRIGIDASNPPFALVTDEGPAGFEIDIGRTLAEQLDAPARFVNMTFDGLYDSLRADQVDMVIATLSIDPLRNGEVLYTRDYFNAGLMLVSDAAFPIEDMNELEEHTLAYEFGAEADSLARRWLRRILPFTLAPYELPIYALDAVRVGQADAALVEAAAAWPYFRQHREWNAHTEYMTYLPYVIAIRRDRAELWAAVDAVLQTLTEDGTLQQIQNRWF